MKSCALCSGTLTGTKTIHPSCQMLLREALLVVRRRKAN